MTLFVCTFSFPCNFMCRDGDRQSVNVTQVWPHERASAELPCSGLDGSAPPLSFGTYSLNQLSTSLNTLLPKVILSHHSISLKAESVSEASLSRGHSVCLSSGCCNVTP